MKMQKRLSLVLLNSSPQNISVRLLEDDQNSKTYQFVLLPNDEGQTQLTWNVNLTWAGIHGKNWEDFLDKIIGPQYEAALENLKKAAENDAH